MGVEVGVEVGVRVGVGVSVAKNGGGVRSEGTLQDSAAAISVERAQRASFGRRIILLSPGTVSLSTGSIFDS